jgi:predicted Zn-dependent protease
MAAQFLKTHPNVRLQVLDEVAHMDRSIGIGQGTRNEDFSLFVRHLAGFAWLWRDYAMCRRT